MNMNKVIDYEGFFSKEEYERFIRYFKNHEVLRLITPNVIEDKNYISKKKDVPKNTDVIVSIQTKLILGPVLKRTHILNEYIQNFGL